MKWMQFKRELSKTKTNIETNSSKALLYIFIIYINKMQDTVWIDFFSNYSNLFLINFLIVMEIPSLLIVK